jgi:LacI family transcriptional regulator
LEGIQLDLELNFGRVRKMLLAKIQTLELPQFRALARVVSCPDRWGGGTLRGSVVSRAASFMSRLRRVAILIDTARAIGRNLLRGVIRYHHEHGPWGIVFRPHGRDEAPPFWLRRWHGDGILARVANQRQAEALRQTGVPIVNLPYDHEGYGFPWLCFDNHGVTRLAAEHLLERGFQHFGFCGWPRGLNARMDERCDLFVQHVEAAGFHCDVFPARSGHRPAGLWEFEQEEIAAWVRALPKPVGVMACYDDRGQHVLAACQLAEVQVPDEVAVIGADNDELLCSLADPPLSSVHSGFDRVGYAAAELLERLMAGGKAPRSPIHLAPLHVVARQSTDVLAIEDRDLAAALRYIRSHAGRGLTVQEVLAAVPMSRSQLERRMKQALGRTPKAEIIRIQLNRVKELLIETNLSLAAIAAKVGYEYPQYLSDLFRKKFGQTPREFRRASRR